MAAFWALVAMARENREYRQLGDQADPWWPFVLLGVVLATVCAGAGCGVVAGMAGVRFDWNGWQVFVVNGLLLFPAMIAICTLGLTGRGYWCSRRAWRALERNDRITAHKYCAIALRYHFDQPGTQAFGPDMRMMMGELSLGIDNDLAASEFAQLIDDPRHGEAARRYLDQACQKAAVDFVALDEFTSADSKQRVGALLKQGLFVRSSIEKQIETEVLRQTSTNNWLIIAMLLAMGFFFLFGKF